MERGNYGRGSGRGGGGGRGRGDSGRGGGRGRGRGDQYQQQYHQQSQHQQYQGGGRGSRGGGPSYASTAQPRPPPAQQWGPPRPVQRYRAPPPPVAAQVSGETSARGAWGSGGGSGRVLFPSQPQRAPEPRPDVPVQDMQSLKLSEQIAVPSPKKTKSSLLPIRRPDGGGTQAIQRPRLLVNHFPVTFNANSTIIHYDVEIKLEDPPKSRSAKVPKSHLRMIKDKLFSDDPSRFPLSSTAFDGERNIFSAEELETGTFKVDFSIGEDTKSCAYTVSITEVSKLRLGKLKEYLSGQVLSIPRDILQGMDLVMKENPSRLRISIGRSFYSPSYNTADTLDGGIVACKGFQHSLKPTSQGLALCLDYSVLAFHKRLPVIDFLMEHLEVKDVRAVRWFDKRVMENLLGLKVTVTHRVTKQKYTIAGLTKENTKDVTFNVEDPEGQAPPRQISIVEYFKEKYGIEIKYKDIPCLDLGKNNRANYVPMEFCVLVEGQRYPKEKLSYSGSMLLKNMSLAQPKDRMRTICEMVRANDGPCGGNVAEKFQIQVTKNMTKVEGRVIAPPQLKLGAPNGRTATVDVDKEKRQWNLVGKSVVDGKPIERWALLDFYNPKDRYGPLNHDQFISNLGNRCQRLGIRMEYPLVSRRAEIWVMSDINRLRSLLENVVSEAKQQSQDKLQIIVCVMANKDPGYKCLKWLSETQIGILTQCCLLSHAKKGNDQYLANLYLKINAKLGGSNVELSKPLPLFEGEGHVMFLGADVNHPAARNSTCPSIAAVVATVNWPAANRYAARVCPQFHRKEQIVGFGTMCRELVQTYARINQVKPQRIVIFRDGVSDGQFDMVLNDELSDIRESIFEERYHPTITLVVAQKRHQTRLFPDGVSQGNVPPGTVVDTVINHPFEFDFYLCSHYGSLGTSKPTHYYVLWDEHKFTSDELQKLIYNLCFTFARCTKPVSLVPPVYYADLVAYRGRMFQEVVMEKCPVSRASSSSSVASASSFNVEFYKVHPDLENIMFFV